MFKYTSSTSSQALDYTPFKTATQISVNVASTKTQSAGMFACKFFEYLPGSI